MDLVDDLFAFGSPALLRALGELRTILVAVGFRVHRPRASETTLRVYPTKEPRPLLNPRFARYVRTKGAQPSRPCLAVYVYTTASQGLRLTQCLPPNTQTLAYEGLEEGEGKHYLAGRFILAIEINPDGTFVPESHGSLGRTLSEMRCLLKAVADTEAAERLER